MGTSPKKAARFNGNFTESATVVKISSENWDWLLALWSTFNKPNSGSGQFTVPFRLFPRFQFEKQTELVMVIHMTVPFDFRRKALLL